MSPYGAIEALSVCTVVLAAAAAATARWWKPLLGRGSAKTSGSGCATGCGSGCGGCGAASGTTTSISTDDLMRELRTPRNSPSEHQ